MTSRDLNDDHAGGHGRTPRRHRRWLNHPASPAKSVELSPWSGPWSEDDPDANFKADVAFYAHIDPDDHDRQPGAGPGYPRGSDRPLRPGQMGDRRQRWPARARSIDDPPSCGNPWKRPKPPVRTWLASQAYDQLRQMLSWLRLPLVDPDAAGYWAGPKGSLALAAAAARHVRLGNGDPVGASTVSGRCRRRGRLATLAVSSASPLTAQRAVRPP